MMEGMCEEVKVVPHPGSFCKPVRGQSCMPCAISLDNFFQTCVRIFKGVKVIGFPWAIE